jgi:hypothetical protein
MTLFRRLLTGAALAVAVAGFASADNIIVYQVTVPATTTDLTNMSALLTAWCPGCNANIQDTTGSIATPAGWVLAPSATAVGVTMASLNAANTTYTLQGYDILVTSSITGNFSITNAANASSNATGTLNESSYTAVSLGAPLTPPLTQIADPTNDLFNNGGTPGNGPNPLTTNKVLSGLAPGQTASKSFSGITGSADLGCDDNAGSPFAKPCSNFFQNLPTSIAGVSVTSTDPLTFYLSTATAINTSITGGNNNEVQNTQVTETIDVLYDYTSSTTTGTPEPTTMALMGGALLGLGLLGKRFKKA